MCSDAWYRKIEAKLPTSDGEGHGPDVGSDEWKSVVERKLGIRGNPDVPNRDSEAWCRHVDQLVQQRGEAAPPLREEPRPAPSAAAAGPTFSCDGVEAGTIEGLICGDPELSALVRKLADVYAAASGKATDEQPPVLEPEQRDWVTGRDECWENPEQRDCVRDAYRRRIAELQARYRLVPFEGPVRFTCDGDPRNEVIATFFRSEPPTLIAERGDGVSLMYQQPSGSGTRYQGRNESFWEHQGEATIVWGDGAPEMRCKKER